MHTLGSRAVLAGGEHCVCRPSSWGSLLYKSMVWYLCLWQNHFQKGLSCFLLLLGQPISVWPLRFLCPLQQQALSPPAPVSPVLMLENWSLLALGLSQISGRAFSFPLHAFPQLSWFIAALGLLFVQGSRGALQDELSPGQAPWHSTSAAPSCSRSLLSDSFWPQQQVHTFP